MPQTVGAPCAIGDGTKGSIVRLYSSGMTSRTGLEAEAISRLTDGLQPPAVRAILMQCLAGELAPSTAVSRMLRASGAAGVRATIDEVTARAAKFSRASDRLVQDRVDELTQVFVESVSELADVSDATKAPSERPQARASRPQGFEDRDGLRGAE